MLKILKPLKGKEVTIYVKDFNLNRIERIKTVFIESKRTLRTFFDAILIFEDENFVYAFRDSQIKCIAVDKPKKSKDDEKRNQNSSKRQNRS